MTFRMVINSNILDLVDLLRERIRAVLNIDDVDLSGTPFSCMTADPYEEKGVHFHIIRLGTDEEKLLKVHGLYWEFVVMAPGLYQPHIHRLSDAFLVFAKGSGRAVLDDQVFPFHEKSAILAAAGMSHGFYVLQPSVMLSIQNRPIKDLETGQADLHPVETPPELLACMA